MNVRRLHRLLGILLLLPLCAWVVTAAIFFVKPGYAAAYDMISIRALPLDALPSGALPSGTLEARAIHTVLGDHLLVRTAAGWSNDAPRAPFFYGSRLAHQPGGSPLTAEGKRPLG